MLDRSYIFSWTPGAEPIATGIRAEPPALTWVDFADTVPLRMIEVTGPLELPGLHPLFLRHLFSNVDPDDPLAESSIDGFDADIAAELAEGERALLFQAFEPVGVDYSASQISLAICRIGFLAGPGWLVTYRAAPFDPRFAVSEGLEPTPRETLIRSARKFVRTDQSSVDVAMLMVRHLARRSSRVAGEFRDEIGNRMVDFHRALLDETTTGPPTPELRRKLFDLRWALDALERSIRPYSEESDAQTERWYSAGSDKEVAAEVRREFAAAVRETREARGTLQDALAWMSAEDARRAVEASGRTLDRQVKGEEETAALNRLVGIVSVVVLGPTLVAAIFSAFPDWFECQPVTRAFVMAVAMLLVVLLSAIALRRLRAARDD